MTDTNTLTGTDISASLPAATQQALNRLNLKKAAWLDTRSKQSEGEAMLTTIRQRRQETEEEAQALNDEWRQLFREYIGAHNDFTEEYALHLWEQFMASNGQALLQLLGLLKTTLGRRAGSVTGVVNSVNDPETVLRQFIAKRITKPALDMDSPPENDPLLKQTGAYPAHAALVSVHNAPSPAALHKLRVQRERAAKEKAQ
ncbi:septation initiation protein [Erwinia billingiae]|uniref:septation initiation protein n=1 Tax=Erwinia billingiae TaxID=182337 RepID=UPI0019D2306E|nr:septation initiation protein [Erwinia billingiae]MBN7122635.1 septation initiation protein [Erwinia billingiae]